MASMKTLLLLLPPVSVLFVLAVRCLARVAARNLTALARAQLACLPAGGSSSSFRHHLAAESRRASRELRVVPYRRTRRCLAAGGAGDEEAAAEVECVVCLSGIEEGEEVRELKCGHLFHRGCLDRWLARPLVATCPLCRCRLLTPSPAALASWEEEYGGDDGEEEEDSDSDMMLFMACVHGRSNWFWP